MEGRTSSCHTDAARSAGVTAWVHSGSSRFTVRDSPIQIPALGLARAMQGPPRAASRAARVPPRSSVRESSVVLRPDRRARPVGHFQAAWLIGRRPTRPYHSPPRCGASPSSAPSSSDAAGNARAGPRGSPRPSAPAKTENGCSPALILASCSSVKRFRSIDASEPLNSTSRRSDQPTYRVWAGWSGGLRRSSCWVPASRRLTDSPGISLTAFS